MKQSTPTKSKRKGNQLERNKFRSGLVFILPSLALCVLFMIWPLVEVVRYSFTDWNGIANRIKKTPFSGPLTFELTSKNRPDRHTHDRYADLGVDGYLSLALEKAKKFRDIFEG